MSTSRSKSRHEIELSEFMITGFGHPLCDYVVIIYASGAKLFIPVTQPNQDESKKQRPCTKHPK